MPFFRVQLQQYIEEEFDSREDAVAAFLEFIEDHVDDYSLTVEEFDEDSGEWELSL